MRSLPSETGTNRFTTWTDWDGYVKLLDVFRDRHIKITYDRGRVELLSPSRLHERLKSLLRSMVECWLEESGIDYEGGGSTTFRRRLLDRGLEPDECYWIRAAAAARGPDVDEEPAPDLVVEVDVTRSSLNRLAIYAALGVPEVWRWTTRRGGKLYIHTLSQPEQYDETVVSPMLPEFPREEFEARVRLALEQGQAPAVRSFRAWLKGQQ